MTILERANPSGKIGGVGKRPNDTFAISLYLAIKYILRTKAADFADLAKSEQVVFTDMLQNISQNINGDRAHGGNSVSA
jgi:hypothetical protein